VKTGSVSIFFYLPCTIKNKVCKLIIDNESYENMVFMKVVKKL